MHNKFREQGIEIAGFYYCPYHKDGTVEDYKEDSWFRKPKPGMILQAAEELDIDIGKSVMIGDKHSDRIALKELRSVILKSTYTGDDFDVEDISALEKII
jgi:histidinol phosphatase-like enzyme